MVDSSVPRADQFTVFHNYWKQLAGDAGGIPARTSFNPADIKDLLPSVFIVERRSADDMHVRLAGTAIEQFLRITPTGNNYLDLVHPDERVFFREACGQMLDTPCGGFFQRDLTVDRGKRHELVTKTLPFKDRDGVARYLFGFTSIRTDLRLGTYTSPITDVSQLISFGYLDVGFGTPPNIPTLPDKRKP